MKSFSLAILVSIFGIVSSIATTARADEEFCGLATIDMMERLNGTWTVKHGIGVAEIGKGMLVPFPPGPPTTVKMAYDHETRLANLTGMQGEELAILPTRREWIPELEGFLTQAEKDEYFPRGDGCDWASLPLMVGSNLYSLTGENSAVNRRAIPDVILMAIAGGQQLSFCEKSYLLGEFVSMAGPSRAQSPECQKEFRENPYYGQNLRVEPGMMAMTLIVKFQSPYAGSGVLAFEGVKDGYQFFARTPVWFSK